jgi:hypothetical protein
MFPLKQILIDIPASFQRTLARAFLSLLVVIKNYVQYVANSYAKMNRNMSSYSLRCIFELNISHAMQRVIVSAMTAKHGVRLRTTTTL